MFATNWGIIYTTCRRLHVFKNSLNNLTLKIIENYDIHFVP